MGPTTSDFSQSRHPFNPSPPVTRRAVPVPSTCVMWRHGRPDPTPAPVPTPATAPVPGRRAARRWRARLAGSAQRTARERAREGARAGSHRMCVAVAWPRQSCVAIPHGLSRSIWGRHGKQNTSQNSVAPATRQHCIDSEKAPQCANFFVFVFLGSFGCTALGSAGQPRPTHPPTGVDVML